MWVAQMTMRTDKFLVGLLILVSMMFNSGCDQNRNGANEILVDGDVVVLAANRHLAPGEKDGYYCSKILQVWEPLITNHEVTGKPEPGLAERWEMKEAGKVWQFSLRKDVYFHDGTKFNADAVLKNFERMQKGLKKSNFYAMDINTFYPGLVKYEKIDEYTIQLTFSTQNVDQLYHMMNFGSAMYSPACFDEQGNFREPAIGTGPFKIKENVAHQYVLLERNEQYYGTLAKSKQILIKNIPSPEVRYSALKAEEIMGVLDLNAIPPVLAEEIRQDDRFAVSVSKSMMTRFLLVNGSKFPFQDVRMRRALSLAIDRQALVSSLYLNYAKPTVNMINYTSPFYKELRVEHDLEQARALVEQVLKGKRYTLLYCIDGADPLQKGEAELIAYWLDQIGLDVKIQALEYSTMQAKLRRGEYDIARSQQGLPNGNPYFIFNAFMMPQGARNVGSSLGYKNQEVIDLMDEVKQCVSESKRQKIFDRLQEISAEELPIVPLFQDMNIVAYHKRLQGYRAQTYGITLSDIEVKRGE
ncbi:ABC transporter substrate-binding protein [Anaerosinus massiliensis]|uniref:ABC transporter substrate-binding protein n=1 Tax=Massilibacillus massiliensis TaxID=1806837 RepID=UPI0018FEC553|nr:ABC transporter substrate-binding protein [Massilibacillus massiliensis]